MGGKSEIEWNIYENCTHIINFHIFECKIQWAQFQVYSPPGRIYENFGGFRPIVCIFIF